ncbi:MAG: hypothetical protein AAGG48_07880 [Planctomycetota bacterium]
MPLHYVLHLINFVFQLIIRFFSRTVEVFLRVSFGKRYLTGRFGIGSIFFQATIVLVSGVVLTAPVEVFNAITQYEPGNAVIRSFVDRTSPRSVDMRESARQALENMQDSYVTDEAVSQGSGIVSRLYRAGFETISYPFSAFCLSFLVLGFLHVRSSHANEQVNEFCGLSHIADLASALPIRIVYGIVEPLSVIALGLICWGQIPGSKIHFPLSLDIDPILGRYLLCAGVCFLVKEQLRLTGLRQSQEDIESRQRAAGRNPGVNRELADLPIVNINEHSAFALPSKEEAFSMLPPEIKAILIYVPELRECERQDPMEDSPAPTPRPIGTGEDANTEDEDEDKERPGRTPSNVSGLFACPKCGQKYRFKTGTKEGTRNIRCRRCSQVFAVGREEERAVR